MEVVVSDESEKPRYYLGQEDLAKVFEEWKRRWDEDPDSFESDEEFKAQKPETYGEGAARYFTRVVKDVLAPQDGAPEEELIVQ